jgi:DNA-binding response OmpR family regulator
MNFRAPMLVAAELAFLRDRVAELEAILGIRDSALDPLYLLNLTRTQVAIVGLLYRSKVVSKDTLYTALYGGRSECDWPVAKTLDVQLNHTRQRLKPHGIEIRNKIGVGWFFDAESKQRIRRIVEAA